MQSSPPPLIHLNGQPVTSFFGSSPTKQGPLSLERPPSQVNPGFVVPQPPLARQTGSGGLMRQTSYTSGLMTMGGLGGQQPQSQLWGGQAIKTTPQQQPPQGLSIMASGVPPKPPTIYRTNTGFAQPAPNLGIRARSANVFASTEPPRSLWATQPTVAPPQPTRTTWGTSTSFAPPPPMPSTSFAPPPPMPSTSFAPPPPMPAMTLQPTSRTTWGSGNDDVDMASAPAPPLWGTATTPTWATTMTALPPPSNPYQQPTTMASNFGMTGFGQPFGQSQVKPFVGQGMAFGQQQGISPYSTLGQMPLGQPQQYLSQASSTSTAFSSFAPPSPMAYGTNSQFGASSLPSWVSKPAPQQQQYFLNPPASSSTPWSTATYTTGASALTFGGGRDQVTTTMMTGPWGSNYASAAPGMMGMVNQLGMSRPYTSVLEEEMGVMNQIMLQAGVQAIPLDAAQQRRASLADDDAMMEEVGDVEEEALLDTNAHLRLLAQVYGLSDMGFLVSSPRTEAEEEEEEDKEETRLSVEQNVSTSYHPLKELRMMPSTDGPVAA